MYNVNGNVKETKEKLSINHLYKLKQKEFQKYPLGERGP